MRERRIRVHPDVRFGRQINADPSGCWIWKGCPDKKGYGRFFDQRVNRQVLAHRWAYERFRGEIPEGLTLDHLCRRPICVNPWHLEPVTSGINTRRSETTIASRNAAKMACPKGHPYEHTIEYGKPRRRCRICQRAAVRECMRRKRERKAG